MTKIGIIGLGKMGISHLSIFNAQPNVTVVGICDNSAYLSNMMEKITSIKSYTEPERLINECAPDALVIATPTITHASLVEFALHKKIHVFCEKPFCIDVNKGAELSELAQRKNLVNQVGYHSRFTSSFEKAHKLVLGGVIGAVYHARAEVYGAVILAPNGKSWRSTAQAGGSPSSVAGTVLNSIYSSDVEDEVYSNFFYADGRTASIAANWSDRSFRKMSTRIELWGSKGKIIADRQEVHIHLHDKASVQGETYSAGWTSLNNLSLKNDVNFYLRGEEYSMQVEHFISCIENNTRNTRSTFYTAHNTDVIADMMNHDVKISNSRHANHDGSTPKKRAGNWISTIKDAMHADRVPKSSK
jgi:predicted dehydrogenase